MKLEELEQQCKEQLKLMPEASIGLMMPGSWGKTNYRFLLGVKGNIVYETETHIYVLFPAQELLDTILKRM